MGTSYYVVVPKLKIMIYLGRHMHEEEIDEDLEKFNKFFVLWHQNFEGEISCIYEIEDKILRKITLKDIMILFFYTSELTKLFCIQNSPEFVTLYKTAKYLDKKSYIISEYSEKINELEKEGYKTINEDERN